MTSTRDSSDGMHRSKRILLDKFLVMGLAFLQQIVFVKQLLEGYVVFVKKTIDCGGIVKTKAPEHV